MEHNDTSFTLSDTFLNKYKRRKPDFGPLGLFVYKRSYSRIKPNGKSEEWWETVRRVVEGTFLIQKKHCKELNIPWTERKAKKSAQVMYDKIWNMKFTPPGRGLFAMGISYIFDRSSAPLYNCGMVSTANLSHDFSGPFVWQMDKSMMGIGVGFDTVGAYEEFYLKSPRKSADIHIVEDSREGWVAVFKRVLDSFSGKDSLPKEFDYSQIRNEGEPIKGFGGFAPGYRPLEKLVNRVTNYCFKYVNEELPVDSTFIVDIMNFSGACVVAGGQRRTAQIAFGNDDDFDFIHLKDKDKITDENLARWASNNSVFVSKGQSYDELTSQTAINGEPGYVWLENCRHYGRMVDGRNDKDVQVCGVNPCAEITLANRELCNIAEVYPSRHNDINEFLSTLKYAFMYCKTVTLLKTHDQITNQVQMKNRRIGISLSGIVENINKIGYREHMLWCKEGYRSLERLDSQYSDWFCIPRSIKLTTVKPSGTVSLLPQVTPGIHFPHSEYYIRRIRISRHSTMATDFEEAGYHIESDVYEKDKTLVVSIPVHEPFFSKRKQDVSMWEQLELAAQHQAFWADNSVSITVSVKPDEIKDLAIALSMYETRLKSISFLPLAGDKIYKQAPYEEITKEQYEKMTANLKPVKFKIDESEKVEEKFCDSDVCKI
ncbi:MAG: hypothetical protein SVK08_00955 [Halobacteriota archaeon]|nr:hypothetical protein [Halobacteriota archaeon]